MICCMLCLLAGLSSVAPARILLLPFNSYSHVKLMTLSSTQLLQAGHEVWMLSSLPPARYNTSMGRLGWLQVDLPPIKEAFNKVSCVRDSRLCYESFFKGVHQRTYDHCSALVTNTSLMADLRDMNFSLAIVDGLQVFRCISLVPLMLNVSYLTLSIQHNAWLAGVPSLPSVEPHQLTSFSSDMSFHQRVANTLIYIADSMLRPLIERDEDRLLQRVLPDGPYRTLGEVAANSVMWLTVSQPTCLDYPRSTAPHYVEVNMPTPFYDSSRVGADLQAFADGAHHGLVLVTFGCMSTEGLLPSEIREIFLETFRGMPQRFVLKYTVDSTLNVTSFPDNVFPMEWLPLDELLSHPNTKVLVTQSGAVSMNEAVLHGVPLLVIPFLFDQGYNAKRAMEHGWGMSLEKNKLSTETLHEALTVLLRDESFSTSAHFCGNLLKTLPSGEESVAFWVDHAFTYGWRHLSPRVGRGSMVVLLLMDVTIILCAIIVLVIYIIFRFLIGSALIWIRAKQKYPKAHFWLSPFMTLCFVVSMLHSIYTMGYQ